MARTLEVLGVDNLSPRMARVTLGGEELAGFATAAPTDHVRVFFPGRGRRPVLPTVVDGRLTSSVQHPARLLDCSSLVTFEMLVTLANATGQTVSDLSSGIVERRVRLA